MSRASRVFLPCLVIVGLGSRAAGKEGDLIAFLPFAVPSPQDIAYDETDGTYWITTFLDGSVHHYSGDLTERLDVFTRPFGPNQYFTGIAYDSVDDTVFVADSVSGLIQEMDKTGLPTGRVIDPPFELQPDGRSRPTVMGMAFYRGGDDGHGSLFVVEAAGTLIYEFTLDGRALRSFIHPDDPDGFPGKGAPAPGNHDVEPILSGTDLVGFYVTGGRGGLEYLRRLDADGIYTGTSISLDDTGGTVSGVLRRPFRRPDTGAVSDSYLCVVESSARVAVLEGGEPSFREILDFSCSAKGKDVEITWTSPQVYDGIEVHEGCEVLAGLPGTATSWSHTFAADGVHEISVRAFQGDASSEPPSCTVVVGGGEVLSEGEVQGPGNDAIYPFDLATNGDGLLLVTANLRTADGLQARVLLYDYDFQDAGSIDVPAEFSGPEDFVSGIAFGSPGGEQRIYLFNAVTTTLGVLDGVGALVDAYPVDLPNLEPDPEKDPDYGFGLGMTFDPDGNGGEGSLWLVEVIRDQIYELDLRGHVIRDVPHPYLAVNPPPAGSPWGIQSSGIARIPWSTDERFLVGGGGLRDSGQPHVFEMDGASGQVVPGTIVPTDGIRQVGSTYYLTFEAIVKDGQPRLVALAGAGIEYRLLEVSVQLPPVAKPTFLSASQRGYEDAVTVSFQNNGPYDSVEVSRDCSPVASLPGDSTSFVERGVDPGIHEYAVRGVKLGASSDIARSSLRVGVGAVLEQRIAWPALYPQQLTRDPVDGSFYVVGSYPGDERNIHHFDRNLEYLDTREALADPEWQVATHAVRRRRDEAGELWYITWQQPVPLGGVASQRFLLVTETLGGSLVDQREISASVPIPSNGFIRYPTGLTWNPATDTFLFLERNSRTFVEIATDGSTVRQFPHVDPPFQNFVFALGLCIDPERGTLFYTTALRHDHRVTLVRELTLAGVPTGVEIPLDGAPHSVTGISVSGPDLVAVGTYRFPELLRIKAFSALPPPFIRGDSDGNGVVNLTDVIFTLDYLFRGGAAPACEDGADADDSSELNLTDAVVTLQTLFLGGGPLPAPYPSPGQDPTPDGLRCNP